MERLHFEDELKGLKQRLLNMGALVEERVHRAVSALIERRPELAEGVIAGDGEINDLQIEIDDRALKLLALQAPMAGFLGVLNGLLYSMVGALEALKEQRAASGAATQQS